MEASWKSKCQSPYHIHIYNLYIHPSSLHGSTFYLMYIQSAFWCMSEFIAARENPRLLCTLPIVTCVLNAKLEA